MTPPAPSDGAHRVPRPRRGLLVVLAEHVERSHQHRLQPGELEPADPEVDPGRIAVGLHRGHAGGIDLQADDLEAVDLGAESLDELQGGHR